VLVEQLQDPEELARDRAVSLRRRGGPRRRGPGGSLDQVEELGASERSAFALQACCCRCFLGIRCGGICCGGWGIELRVLRMQRVFRLGLPPCSDLFQYSFPSIRDYVSILAPSPTTRFLAIPAVQQFLRAESVSRLWP
jgi:hypothetical protein